MSNPAAPGPGGQGRLEALVRNFDRDAAGNGRQIRELLSNDRNAFLVDAVRVLKQQDDSRGSQYVISQLVNGDLLLEALCDRSLSLSQAIVLAQAAVRTGAMADVILAKYVSEHAASTDDPADQSEIHRLMDILLEISDGTRILPCLMSLSRLSNPYVRSKAVLMIGRINRSVKWVQQRLAEPDARVRGNAVEALWGNDSEEARQLLRAAVNDVNNRVAGNALIGLYRLGDPTCIPQLLKMAGHSSRLFRATAAWVMGESGDARFNKVLGRMLAEPHVEVRTRAFAALSQIRTATTQARQAGKWNVVVRFLRNRRSGWRELHLDVASQDRQEQVHLLPTQLLLMEDGQEVVHYSVEERPAPPGLAITFIFPRNTAAPTPFQVGARRALEWKRPSDLWSIAPYLPPVSDIEASFAGEKIPVNRGDAVADAASAAFTCDPETAAAALERIPSKMNCTGLWSTLKRSVLMENAPARGQRHLVVYTPSEAEQTIIVSEVASAAIASQTTLHVISGSANAALEGLCQTTHGSYNTAASENDAGELVEQVYLGLMARHTVRYQPVVPEAHELRAVVSCPSGWGEVSVPIPGHVARDG